MLRRFRKKLTFGLGGSSKSTFGTARRSSVGQIKQRVALASTASEVSVDAIMTGAEADVELPQVKPDVGKARLSQAVSPSVINMDSIWDATEAMRENDVLSLPDNIYTAAIILPYIRNQKAKSTCPTCERLWRDLQILMLVGANVVAQIFLIRYIADIYVEGVDESGRCGSTTREVANLATSKELRAISLAIFIGFCLIDFLETWNMLWWWLDLSNAYPKCVFSCISTILSCVTCGCCKWELKRNASVADKDGNQSDSALEMESRFQGSNWMRKAFVFFIILCKFLICVSLVVIGTGFLLLSETNADLILNALALTFILDLSTMFYQFFLTTEMKTIVETFTPIVIVKTDATSNWFSANVSIAARSAVLGFSSLFMYSFYCTSFWRDGHFDNKS